MVGGPPSQLASRPKHAGRTSGQLCLERAELVLQGERAPGGLDLARHSQQLRVRLAVLPQQGHHRLIMCAGSGINPQGGRVRPACICSLAFLSGQRRLTLAAWQGTCLWTAAGAQCHTAAPAPACRKIQPQNLGVQAMAWLCWAVPAASWPAGRGQRLPGRPWSGPALWTRLRPWDSCLEGTWQAHLGGRHRGKQAADRRCHLPTAAAWQVRGSVQSHRDRTYGQKLAPIWMPSGWHARQT